MKLRRRFYISWVGLRGAVPIVFATYPLLAGIEKADMIFNIVFFISVTSILVQGTTLPIVARWLRVALPVKNKPLTESEMLILNIPKTVMKEIKVLPHWSAVNQKIVHLNFPENAIIAMIKRKDKYLTPNGSTVIEANDILVILSDNQKGLDKAKISLNKQVYLQKIE